MLARCRVLVADGVWVRCAMRFASDAMTARRFQNEWHDDCASKIVARIEYGRSTLVLYSTITGGLFTRAYFLTLPESHSPILARTLIHVRNLLVFTRDCVRRRNITGAGHVRYAYGGAVLDWCRFWKEMRMLTILS